MCRAGDRHLPVVRAGASRGVGDGGEPRTPPARFAVWSRLATPPSLRAPGGHQSTPVPGVRQTTAPDAARTRGGRGHGAGRGDLVGHTGSRNPSSRPRDGHGHRAPCRRHSVAGRHGPRPRRSSRLGNVSSEGAPPTASRQDAPTDSPSVAGRPKDTVAPAGSDGPSRVAGVGTEEPGRGPAVPGRPPEQGSPPSHRSASPVEPPSAPAEEVSPRTPSPPSSSPNRTVMSPTPHRDGERTTPPRVAAAPPSPILGPPPPSAREDGRRPAPAPSGASAPSGIAAPLPERPPNASAKAADPAAAPAGSSQTPPSPVVVERPPSSPTPPPSAPSPPIVARAATRPGDSAARARSGGIGARSGQWLAGERAGRECDVEHERVGRKPGTSIAERPSRGPVPWRPSSD